MLRLLLFMHFNLMHCIIMILAHKWLIYPLGHVYAEPKLEVQVEQVQKEHGGPQATSYVDTNLALDQGKPWCIIPNS
jgi:hypothetical protein